MYLKHNFGVILFFATFVFNVSFIVTAEEASSVMTFHLFQWYLWKKKSWWNSGVVVESILCLSGMCCPDWVQVTVVKSKSKNKPFLSVWLMMEPIKMTGIFKGLPKEWGSWSISFPFCFNS